MYEPRRRRPLRMPSFDYASSGAYFLTICVQERACLFGEVTGEGTHLSPAGTLVASIWRTLPDRFPRVRLDAFVVMPNHLHGILWLTDDPVGVGLAPPDGSISGGASPTPTKKRPTLSQIVGAFKSLSTVQVNRLQDTQGRPLWQRNFYERVVRNETELLRFRTYIAENPARWPQDPEHPNSQRQDPPAR